MSSQWTEVVDLLCLSFHLSLGAERPESQEKNNMSVSRLDETVDDPTKVVPLLAALTNPAFFGMQQKLRMLEVDSSVHPSFCSPAAQICKVVSQAEKRLRRKLQFTVDVAPFPTLKTLWHTCKANLLIPESMEDFPCIGSKCKASGCNRAECCTRITDFSHVGS